MKGIITLHTERGHPFCKYKAGDTLGDSDTMLNVRKIQLLIFIASSWFQSSCFNKYFHHVSKNWWSFRENTTKLRKKHHEYDIIGQKEERFAQPTNDWSGQKSCERSYDPIFDRWQKYAP